MDSSTAFFFCCLAVVSSGEAIETLPLADRNADLVDVTFSDDVIKESPSSVSAVECAALCRGSGPAESFTFTAPLASDVTKGGGACRCHGSAMTSSSSQAAAASTLYYEFDRGGVVGGSTLLKQACTGTGQGDCPTDVTLCHNGLCTCRYDTFYSVGQDDCVPDCSELSVPDQWLEHPNTDCWGCVTLGNLVERTTLEGCKNLCGRLIECQAVKVDHGKSWPNNCTHAVMYDEDNVVDYDNPNTYIEDSGYTIYKRFCV